MVRGRRWRVRFPMVLLVFFHWHNPSGRTMALGSIQPLTEINTRNIVWGVKAAGEPHLCADCFKIWKPQNPGTLRACPGM